MVMSHLSAISFLGKKMTFLLGYMSPHATTRPMSDTNVIPGRILVIEDDLDVQELIVAFFKQNDYQVTAYDSADGVLRSFEREKPAFDVIVTDLMLPNLSGIEFIKSIRELGMDVPIILITANKTVETAVEAIKAGAYDFVVKPLHFPQLLISVQRALYFQKIRNENSTLKAVVETHMGSNFDGIIGKSPPFRRVLDVARRVANSTANIFISGESGTGKEIIARAIHNLGPRRKAPFIAINCSAIPETLLESEFFGHAKGAFTGASDRRVGLFEEADNGTLFLDEIGDLSLPLQAKLLRVIQERKIKRIGENQFRNVNVRVISATHRDLRQEVSEKRFREDLFFRLNVIPIHIPPLRERKEDIIPLAEFFLQKFYVMNGTPKKSFSKCALEKMLAAQWRGNVRELENAIERAVVLSDQPIITAKDLPDETENWQKPEKPEGFQFSQETQSGQVLTIDELVKKYVKHVLDRNGWAKEKTSRELGIDRKTLYRKIKEIEHKI